MNKDNEKKKEFTAHIVSLDTMYLIWKLSQTMYM